MSFLPFDLIAHTVMITAMSGKQKQKQKSLLLHEGKQQRKASKSLNYPL